MVRLMEEKQIHLNDQCTTTSAIPFPLRCCMLLFRLALAAVQDKLKTTLHGGRQVTACIFFRTLRYEV